MSTVITTTVKTEPTTDTLTFGAAGDSVAISGDSLNLNTLQDAGGNTIFVSDGSGTITSKNSGFPGAFNLISTQTVGSAVASIDFTSGIDTTYDVYIFKIINVRPATDNTNFTFQANMVGQSGFNETISSTYFAATHFEDDTYSALAFDTGRAQTTATAYQCLFGGVGNGADEAGCAELYLFSPSNTSYLKRFCCIGQFYNGSNASENSYAAGYFTNEVTAMDQISFKFASGNIEAGTIKLYGLTKS